MGTLLRRRVAMLRLSILAAAGITPIACSGTVTRNRGDDGTGNANQGGTRNTSKPKPPTGVGGSGPTGMGGAPTGMGGAPTMVTAGNATFGGTAGSIFPPCTAPQLDPWSGLVTCQEGYEHRPAPGACDVAVVGGAPGESGGAGGVGGDGGPPPRADGTVPCDDASNCRQFELGYCQDSSGGGGVAVCQSGCTTDEDCGPGALCVCDQLSTRGGVCHPSDCKSDQDCGAGFRCASYDVSCGTTPFACQKPGDECAGPNDCEQFVGCVASADGPRVCTNLPDCGRPFLVEETARKAPVVASSSWRSSEPVAPAVDDLSDIERAALADHWTRMGQMEHASIAAFARFSLQLLALGAPAGLVDDCTRALADETAHAKLCFQLASAYAGRSIGPGALDISGSLSVTTLSDIVDLVIAEGCFGETSAALEALEAAEQAADPVIAAAYARIAEDEQRHATLAFRFLRWALTREPYLVRQRILIALRTAPNGHSGVRDVVLPCLDALLATYRVPSTEELFT